MQRLTSRRCDPTGFEFELKDIGRFFFIYILHIQGSTDFYFEGRRLANSMSVTPATLTVSLNKHLH